MFGKLRRLVILWPLLILIGVAIRLDSSGSVLYRQRRVGENGRLFEMFKFRTMVADAEKQTPPQIRSVDGKVFFINLLRMSASLALVEFYAERVSMKFPN